MEWKKLYSLHFFHVRSCASAKMARESSRDTSWRAKPEGALYAALKVGDDAAEVRRIMAAADGIRWSALRTTGGVGGYHGEEEKSHRRALEDMDVKHFLDTRAGRDHRECGVGTLVHHAVLFNRVESLRAMLAGGAPPACLSSTEKTPVEWAKQIDVPLSGTRKIVSRLLGEYSTPAAEAMRAALEMKQKAGKVGRGLVRTFCCATFFAAE
jgi:hypothetical protein